MFDEETALFMLRMDGKCPEAEERLQNLLVDLERSGVPPKLIAAALARVMLGFCAEHARTIENFGWARSHLNALSAVMFHRSKKARRSWAGRYLKNAHRLYEAARFQIHSDTVPPPLPPFALEASKPQGTA